MYMWSKYPPLLSCVATIRRTAVWSRHVSHEDICQHGLELASDHVRFCWDCKRHCDDRVCIQQKNNNIIVNNKHIIVNDVVAITDNSPVTLLPQHQRMIINPLLTFFYRWVLLHAFSALCVYSKLGHHPHPLGYLCVKFHFFRGLRCSASPWRKIAYSINHSLISPNLFDAPGLLQKNSKSS